MKHLLKTAISAALLLGSAATAYAKTDITWWDFFSGGDGVRMKALIKEFNDTHPDIHINATTLEWGTPFYTKVQTAEAVGQQPDIMSYHISRYPLAVSQGILRPISDAEMKAAGLSADDYTKAAYDAAKVNGKLYGVPFDIHSIVLYYNKDLLGKAGLLDANGKPKGLNGLANFNAALKKLKAQGVEVPLSMHTDEGASQWRIFYTLLSQEGAPFMKDGKILPDEDAALKAINAARNWVSSGYSPDLISYEASIALFTSGKAAMHINGVWEVPTMKDLAAKGKLGFKWGAVQIPVLFDHAATWADSHSFAIPNSKSNPISEEKVAKVMKIIAWMDKHSLAWADAGHIPAYKPVNQSEAFKKMEPNATYASLLDTASYDPRSPIAGVAGPIYDAMQNYLVPAVNGQLDPEQAIGMMRDDLEGLKMN